MAPLKRSQLPPRRQQAQQSNQDELEQTRVRLAYLEQAERKLNHAEKALHESEQRFHQLIENSHAGYFRVGVSGLYEDVNQAYAAMYRYDTPYELIGIPFHSTQIDVGLDDLFVPELR